MSPQQTSMIILGHNLDDDGNTITAGIPLEDWKTHALMVGTTGSGKSTALTNIAIQFFGLGVSTCIVEPHGDLCLDTLAAIPDNALGQVVYLALDSRQPPAIPLMTLGLAGGLDVGTSVVMSVIRAAEPQAWDASTRMREVLRHSIRVLLEALGRQASLVGLDRFLSKGEDAFRERVLGRASEEVGRSKEYCGSDLFPALREEKGTANMQESVRAARRRLEIFTNDKRLRRTLAVPPLGPRINLAHMLTGGRLVLVPVNAAEMGGKAAPLVSMLVMQMVKTAFMGRTDRTQRQQAAVIIDEFAALASGEVADIVDTLLREARKFGASQILATQSINQLDSETKKNVQINTNHKIVLLVSDADEAREAANVLGSDQIKALDIRNMPRYHGYVRAMAHKEPQPPCLLQMLPPKKLAPLPHLPPPPEPVYPDLSEAWEAVRRLAKGLGNPHDLRAAQPVVQYLRAMDTATWERVVADAMVFNQYHAARLLADPAREPDKVKRALKVSRCIYGLPWWLREAHYWRTLHEGKRAEGRPKKAAAPDASAAETAQETDDFDNACFDEK